VATGTGLIGSTVLHYHVLERLGGGGMGDVYLAEDQRLGRRVALKFLAAHVDRDSEARERLVREAQAAALLRSPHIAVTYDLGEYDGALFIAMEYVEGELLSARIARGPLPVADGLDVALQLADALDEAHGRGIVHRDIKSSNLMLTERHLVKVLDFGLAKFLSVPSADDARTLAGVTMPGLVLGTLSYMAPEQLSGGVVDQRADLFSSGVVLYEMLAGRLPFAGSTMPEIADRILNQEPDAIARYNYNVGDDVDAIVRKALSKRPEFRYQTARDFYIDLLNARRRITHTDSHRGLSAWLSPIDFADAAAPMPMAPAAVARPLTASVAVLNFANITGNPADEWVGQGIAESLTADLTHIKSIVVVPREQIFELQRSLNELGRRVDDRQAMELGRRLNATVTVTGAYQRLGNRIRITAQIIEVAGGRQIATVKMDGELEELFDLQDRLVTELAEGLKVEIAQQDKSAIAHAGTLSIEAYEAYSRGMLNLRLAGRESIDRGIALLEEALEHDPRYVEAMVSLAAALEVKGSFLALPDLFERSLRLAAAAIALRPDDAGAHVQYGDTLLSMGRVDDAIVSLREGVRLQPDRAAAHGNLARAYWLGKGDVDSAIEEFEQTLRLNPSAGYAHLQLALLYTLRGDFTAAEQLARDAIRLQDQAMSGTTGLLLVGAHSRLGYVHYRQGRYDDAIREYRRELEMLSVGDHLLRERTSIELQQKLGAAYRRRGDLESAAAHEAEALQRFETRLAAGADEPFTRYYIAAVYALRGEAETARQHLQRPLDELAAFTRWRLPRDPDFDAVREHPLFQNL
jgi:TolB-like protein/Tfp pilus assembly protein PilF/predicted Ser/Thr protein kinase